jgi:serine protease inhibitor
MRPTTRSLLLLAVAALPVGCADGPTQPSRITALPRDLTAGEQQVVAADNRFTFALFHQAVVQESPDANLFLSPLSVGMALGMTANGAAGRTRDSMLTALQLTGASLDDVNRGYRGVIDLLRGLDPRVELTLANSIWYRNTIQPGQPFLDAARTWFDARVSALDFAAPAAVATINDWVNTQTRGKIPTIVDDIPDSAIMYLINAIYFKGSWTQRFDPALTHDAPFTLRDGGQVTAPTMEHRDAAPALYTTSDGVTVVDLPYGGRAFAMTLVLPPTPDGIDALAAELTQEGWDAWMAALDSAEVVVVMPKFRITFERELKPYLDALGMGVAFVCGEADFTPLFPAAGTQTCITRVKHKTFVDVYEEGTEAAAVTSVEVGVTSVPAGPVRVVVDRPFLVAIRERFTGTILFLGRVTNPAAI